jgi:hypothetical protein
MYRFTLHLGHKAVELIGSFTLAALAGAAILGMLS